jgi:hypothetical protein
MRRALANRFPRLVMALMVVAAMLSSGGFAKHAHLWSAHSHGTCGGGERASCSAHPIRSLCGHSHRTDAEAPAAPSKQLPVGNDVDHQIDGQCSVCAELAFLTPTLPLASPFTTVLAVLAIVHDREAAQLPDPAAPALCAARPPPSLA